MTVSSTTTKVSYSGNGSLTVFAYTFKVFDQADLKVIVRTDATGTETVKTITTDYTVSGVGNTGGGNVTFVTAPASGETVVIRREASLTQTTDYTPNDPFPASSHEDALDKLTFFAQQQQEELDRAIKLSRTNTITSTEFTVGATDRANKILAFDGNGEISVTQELGTFQGNWSASTAYAARDIVKDTSTNNIFIANTAHTSSGSQPLTTNTDSAKWDLLVDAASATTSATNAATSATAAATSATAAATSATNAATSATSASTAQTAAETAKTAAETAQTAAETAKTAAETALDTFDDIFLGAKASDPTLDNDGDALQDGALYFDTTNNVFKVYDLGGTQWLTTVPSSSDQTNINTVAGISANVTTVAGISANVTTVAGISSDVTTVAADGTDIGTVAGISSNVTTVAGVSSDVTTVAGQISPTNNISTVAGISSNVTTVAGISANVTTVAGVSSDVTTVAGVSANVTTVATDITNVNTVATNISGVNSFAERYRVASADPSTSLDAGDLAFNTTDSLLKYYNGSAWESISPGLTDIVGDTTPQLGGNLDTNGNDINFGDDDKAIFGSALDGIQIYNTAAGDKFISEAGGGNLKIQGDNLYFQNSAGTENYIIAISNAAVTLHYDSAAKLATTATGIDVTGTITFDGGTTSADLNFGDNDKAIFGAGSDLQIYHDGSHTYIEEAGTGDLRIKGVDVVIQQSDGNNQVASQSGGAVSLSHNGSTKLATTSGGVTVTGTVTATAFAGDGSALTGIAGFPSGTLMLFQQTAAPTGWTKQTTHNDKALRVVSGTAGSGGSSAFSTALGTPTVSGSVSISGNISNTTLSTSQIPSHSHTYQTNVDSGSGPYSAPQRGSTTANTGSTGGGGAHNHGHNMSGSLSSATAGINVQYVDLIIASKD